MEKLIVSDIDGTLLDHGDAAMGLVTLRKLVRVNRERVGLVYATGRTFLSTWQLVLDEVLPMPDGIAALVGTQLWLRPWERPDPGYEEYIAEGWDKGRVEDVLAVFSSHLERQPEEFQSAHKMSYFVTDERLMEEIDRALADAEVAARTIFSAGKHFDVIPARAGKRQAVEYCRRRWNIEPGNVLVSGDSGNDADMLTDPDTLGVIVGNAEEELKDIESSEDIHEAKLPYAAGVLEGAEAFEFWPKKTVDGDKR